MLNLRCVITTWITSVFGAPHVLYTFDECYSRFRSDEVYSLQFHVAQLPNTSVTSLGRTAGLPSPFPPNQPDVSPQIPLSFVDCQNSTGSTIKDMKHKTGCNMWVDQRALKLTITGPDLSSVEHAAKSVDAYVAAAPIKAGAVEAAVTRTLDCPPHLLDMLGDRTTIARIVKETHAQVVVNKKIARIIVRGDHRSVELACQSVQATIQAALHGGLGLRVNTPDSGNGGYFSGSGAVGTPVSLLSPAEGGGLSGMMHMLPTQGGGSGSAAGSDFSVLDTWQSQQLQLQMQPSGHPLRRHHGGGRGSDSDESEIELETTSLGSIGARTPVSSVAGSPRLAVQQAPSLTASPALSAAASTPGGDWSLFSGGFGLGMAALAEGSSCASTPSLTAKPSPNVLFPEGMQALSTSAVVLGPAEGVDEQEGKDAIGASAPPPSPASTTGEAQKQFRQALVNASALEALEGDEDEDGGDIEDKVARLGKALQAMGLGKYCSKFAENEVDLEALGLMSEGDLEDIGIPKGPRLKILNAVSRGGGGAQQAQCENA